MIDPAEMQNKALVEELMAIETAINAQKTEYGDDDYDTSLDLRYNDLWDELNRRGWSDTDIVRATSRY